MLMYSTHEIWPGIYSSHQRCRQAITRLNITMMDNSSIDQDDYVKLLNYRLTTADHKVKPQVIERLTTLSEKPDDQTKSTKRLASVKQSKTKQQAPVFIQHIERIAKWSTSKAVVFLTLVGALSIQIHHLALLVHRVSPQDSLILAYIFGIVSETTALMLTVHQTKKGTLLFFAFVQCWINILYYCDLPDLVIRLTLSGLIAFVIYSYSELFTSLRSTEQNTSVFNG